MDGLSGSGYMSSGGIPQGPCSSAGPSMVGAPSMSHGYMGQNTGIHTNNYQSGPMPSSYLNPYMQFQGLGNVCHLYIDEKNTVSFIGFYGVLIRVFFSIHCLVHLQCELQISWITIVFLNKFSIRGWMQYIISQYVHTWKCVFVKTIRRGEWILFRQNPKQSSCLYLALWTLINFPDMQPDSN